MILVCGVSRGEATESCGLLQGPDLLSVSHITGRSLAKPHSFYLTHPQESLQNTAFPVGHLTKTRVREIAREEGMDRVNQRREVRVKYFYQYYSDDILHRVWACAL